ncbi:MAG TPA: TonB-dependent receptor [Kiritimatiellia bacterium]|nr:TonB-dependent receptor [Kiritimatiellia bacterium]
MKMKRACLVLPGLLVSLSAIAVHADGLRNPPEGMTALGKIGGKIAFIDDASAVTHNPANMVDIDKVSLLGSLTIGYGTKEFESDFGGGKTKSKDNWSALPNVFAVWPITEDSVVAGLALTTPFGRSTTFSKDSPLRYSTPYFTELYAVNINPSIAVKVNERFSIAGGVNVLYSELDLRQIYPWSMALGIPGAPDGETRFNADGAGIGVNAAITWNVTEKQRLAITYRSSVKVEYEGDMKVTGVPVVPLPGPLASVTSKSDFETEIIFPSVVAAGYGIQLTDKLRVEANVEWIQHSKFDELKLDAGANTFLLPSDTIEADWKDNWTYGVGADYALTENMTLRAGLMYLETPIPSRTMLPSIAEENQTVASVGFGYHQGDHRFDFAYAYGFFNGRTVKDNTNPGFNGKYDFEAHLIGASYGLSF